MLAQQGKQERLLLYIETLKSKISSAGFQVDPSLLLLGAGQGQRKFQRVSSFVAASLIMHAYQWALKPQHSLVCAALYADEDDHEHDDDDDHAAAAAGAAVGWLGCCDLNEH